MGSITKKSLLNSHYNRIQEHKIISFYFLKLVELSNEYQLKSNPYMNSLIEWGQWDVKQICPLFCLILIILSVKCIQSQQLKKTLC